MNVKILLCLLFIWQIITVCPLMAQSDSAMICAEKCCCDKVESKAPVGIMVDHLHPKGEIMLEYRYMNMTMNSIKKGTQTLAYEDMLVNYAMSAKSMTMQMHMVMAMYGLTNHITLMGMLNYNQNSMSMQMPMTMQMTNGKMTHPHCSCNENTMQETMQSYGLGDTRLYALFSLRDWGKSNLMGSVGLSLPTANISQTGSSEMMGNFTQPYNMQPGSGSVDWLPALTYRIEGKNANYGTQLSGIYRTAQNARGYLLGNNVSATQWMSLKLNNWLAGSVRAEFVWQDQIKGTDKYIQALSVNDANSDAKNSGYHSINSYAGLNFRIPNGPLKGQRLALEYGIPLYSKYNGVQSATTGILNAALQFKF